MKVSDIKTDAKEVIGYCTDATLYNRLTHAVEVLSKEGNWDSLQAYMDIIVDSPVVTLPRDVLIPLKININNNPAFSRNKLYEFSLNGPGNDMQDTSGYNWMDKGSVPVNRQPNGLAVAAVSLVNNATDIGQTLTIFGLDANNLECSDTLTICAPSPDSIVPSTNTYNIILRVDKPITLAGVALYGMTPQGPPGPPPPPPPIQVATPGLNPPGGTFQRRVIVLVTEATMGATMSYTTDGTMPSRTNGTQVRSSHFNFSPDFGTVVLSVMAFKDGQPDSGIITGTYITFDPTVSPDPTFDPNGGTFHHRVVIRLSAPGADHLAWTVDDLTPPSPTHGHQTNRNFVFLSMTRGTHTFRAMSYTAGRRNSDVVAATFILTIPHDIPQGPDYEDLGENPLLSTPLGNPPPVGNNIPQPLPPEPTPVVPERPVPLVETFLQLAYYYPDETAPSYRQILLTAVDPDFPEIMPKAIRMLYRRKTYVITSDDDWIPLNSQMAVLTMLRALESLRNGTTEELAKVDNLMKQAVDFLAKDQKVLEMFDLAAQSEIPPTLNLNYITADSLVVADIFDNASKTFGPIGRDNVYDKITASIDMLRTMGQWDGLVGYVDLLTDSHYYITLPRYVETPIAININGTPRMMRNKWFEFHLNGPGSRKTAVRYWDDVGDVVTIRPIPAPSKLYARCDLASDNGKLIKVYGYDQNGDPLRHVDPDTGREMDGMVITMSQTGLPDRRLMGIADFNLPLVSRIERITKEVTHGYCQLMAWAQIPSLTVSPVTSADTPSGSMLPFVNVNGIVPGMQVSGFNIPSGTLVLGINGLSVILSLNISGDVPIGTPITFVSASVPSPGFAAIPLGFYHPNELEPNYHRIKLPQKCVWVRMKYRKRAIKVNGLTEPIHLRGKLALTTALQSLKALDDGDTDKQAALEKKAVDFLDREQSSHNPSETFNIQFEGLESAEVII